MAGPRYFPLNLYKDGKKLSSNGYRIDSCLISFNPKNDLHLEFDICKKRVEKFVPNKKNIKFGSSDSIKIFSNKLNKSKKLTPEKVKLFEKHWNLSKPRGYRDNKDSIFYPSNHEYKISVFQNDKEKVFLTYSYLINDRSNWVYSLGYRQNKMFFEELWNDQNLE